MSSDGQAAFPIGRRKAENVLESDALRIAASDQCCTCRRTHGPICVSISEPDTFASETIRVRGPDIGPSVCTQVTVAEVVHHHEDDVWLRALRV